jgi:ABC-type taurine transport system ATPase subunit
MSFPGKTPGEPIHVLERVNFEVRDGEFVCLVGPSGCGKSTLLNIVAGFLQASRGELHVEGEPVRGPDPRRIFVFQENGVFPWLTVEENVGFGLLKKSGPERRRTVQHYIEMVGLVGFERAYPANSRTACGNARKSRPTASPDIIYAGRAVRRSTSSPVKNARRPTRIWQSERKTILFVT